MVDKVVDTPLEPEKGTGESSCFSDEVRDSCSQSGVCSLGAVGFSRAFRAGMMMPEGELTGKELLVDRIEVGVEVNPRLRFGEFLPQALERLEVAASHLHGPDLSGQVGRSTSHPASFAFVLDERPRFVHFEGVAKVNRGKRLLQRRQGLYSFLRRA